jgi:predicted MFS family arabinose efflux permease
MALLSVWGGWLADRLPRRELIAAAQAGQLVQAMLLVLLVLFAPPAVEWLFAVSLLLGVLNAIDTPARLAFQIELVGREDLPNAIALNSLAFNLARAVGPALGAPLLWQLGPVGCFAVNALTFVPVLLALWLMRLPPPAPRLHHDDPGDSARYLLERPRLLLLLLLAGGMAFFGWPLLSLLPALADTRLSSGEEGAAWLMSSIGTGALIGALIVATFNSFRARMVTLVAGVVLGGGGLAALSAVTGLRAGMVLCGIAGLGLILFFATGQATMHLGADDRNRGRVLGVWLTILAAAHPLGHLTAGWMADRWGVARVLWLQSLGIGVTAAVVGVLALAVFTRGRQMTTVAPTTPNVMSMPER